MFQRLAGMFVLLFCFCLVYAENGCDKKNMIVADDEQICEPVYEPTWESFDTRPLPNWYDKAKIGIFIHWGVYSVPSMGSEWFWENWQHKKAKSYVDYMNKNFKPGFTYQEFANDFTAEHFNANEWADIFEQSGAKYVVLTSKHHDGYALWPSKYSFGWNSVDVGPHRDIIKELSDAIRSKTTLKFGLYHSLYEWFNPLFLDDKSKGFKENNFVTTKVLPELKELVNTYKPEVIWSDGEWEANYQYWNSTDFIAWLYNESPVKKTVVINDRWGSGSDVLCKHGDFFTCADRYNPGVKQSHKWENAMTLDTNSWGYRENARIEDYLTSKELIEEIVTTVSCGGNILINVGPSKSGIISPIFVERLQAMGNWLLHNGEAIYDSKPWKYQNDTKTLNIWYTSGSVTKDSNNRTIVYAIILNYPYDSDGVKLYSLGGIYDNSTRVNMLGIPGDLKWYGSKESMYVIFPAKTQIDKLRLKFAWTLKIDIPMN